MIATRHTPAAPTALPPAFPRTACLVHDGYHGWIAVWNPDCRTATIIHHPKDPETIGTPVHVCDRPQDRPPRLRPGITLYLGDVTVFCQEPEGVGAGMLEDRVPPLRQASTYP